GPLPHPHSPSAHRRVPGRPRDPAGPFALRRAEPLAAARSWARGFGIGRPRAKVGTSMAEREFYSRKVLYPAIVALVALSVLFGFAILPRLFPESTLTGRPAPDFALEVVGAGSSGDRIHLAELKGQAVVLDFWATWC